MLLALRLNLSVSNPSVVIPIVAGAADYSRPKQYVVKRGEQLFIYRSKAQALAAFRAEQDAEDSQVPAKSKKAAQRAIKRQAINLPEVEQYAKDSGRIEQYQRAYTSEHLDALLAMFNDMCDEDDIEFLLCHAIH